MKIKLQTMKKNIFLGVIAAVLTCACSPNLPMESTISKSDVDFAGNADSYFGLGGDVKMYTVQNPDNDSQWTIQAVVPVNKDADTPFEQLTIDIIPSDDEGDRVVDGLTLQSEELPEMLSSFNTTKHVERTILFSILEKEKKYMSPDEVAQLMDQTKKLRMVFIVKTADESSAQKSAPTPLAPAKTPTASPVTPAKTVTNTPEKPAPPKESVTLDGLFRKYGIHGLLSQYEQALSNGNKKGAKQIEDRLWEIEKSVRSNNAIPEQIRSSFVSYIENKEDEIEDKY